MSEQKQNTATNTHKSLSDASFREEYKEFCKKGTIKKTRELNKSKSWCHKESCLKCKIAPLLRKHFQIPNELTDFCSCYSTKRLISLQYNKICRISLLDSLSTYSYKLKQAKLANFCINVDGIDYKIDILKLKAGAIKRYTQPGTENGLIGTAVFHNTSIFWKLNEKYYLEFRLKSKHSQSLLYIDSKRKSNDVASWWFQNWAIYGLMEHNKKQKNNNGEFLPVDGVINHNGMRLKPFIAAHHNDFVSDGDLKKSLNRIVLVLHKKKPGTITDINANTNATTAADTTTNEETKVKINNKLIELNNGKIKRKYKHFNGIRIKVKQEDLEISSSEETEIRKHILSNGYHNHHNHIKMERKYRKKKLKRKRSEKEEESEDDNDDASGEEGGDENESESDDMISSLRKETIKLRTKIVNLEHEKYNLQQQLESYRVGERHMNMNGQHHQVKIENNYNNYNNSHLILRETRQVKIERESDIIHNLKNQINSLQNELSITQQNNMNILPIMPTYEWDNVNSNMNNMDTKCERERYEQDRDIRECEINNLNDRIKILTNDNERLKAINKNEQISFHQRMYQYQYHIALQMQQILNNNNKEKDELVERIKKLEKEKEFWSNKCKYQLQLNSHSQPPSAKRQKLNHGSFKKR